MRDPHVNALHYKMITASGLSFKDPSSIERHAVAFIMRLANGTASFMMKDHYSTEAAAKAVVEPFLEAWEIFAGVNAGRKEFWFQFDHSEIVDRSPEPSRTVLTAEDGIIRLNAGELNPVGVCEAVRLHRTCSEYPKPPTMFAASPDVKSLWDRYEGYLRGRELLSTMAYWCLSVLENSVGGRDAAARKYRIDRTVLGKLGHFSTNVGDDMTARKKGSESLNRPYTSHEVTWIESVVRALILRWGEYSFDASRKWPILTMADFPRL